MYQEKGKELFSICITVKIIVKSKELLKNVMFLK